MMEKLTVKYQPIINIQIDDDAFDKIRFSIEAKEQTRIDIDKHSSLERNEHNLYSLAFITQKESEHKSLEDQLESDFSLKGKIEQHSIVTYDYQKQNQEYAQQVILPAADAATTTKDISNHIFENNLLLKLTIKVNPLLKDSLLPLDSNEAKLIFLDDILTPSTHVREKLIVISPIEENGSLRWQLEEEGKAIKVITKLNLEDGVLAECHVNIPAHLVDVHSIKYHIHVKRKVIINP